MATVSKAIQECIDANPAIWRDLFVKRWDYLNFQLQEGIPIQVSLRLAQAFHKLIIDMHYILR